MEHELTIIGGQHPADEFEALEQMRTLDLIASHHGGRGAGPWKYRFETQDAAQDAAREFHEMGFDQVRIEPVKEVVR